MIFNLPLPKNIYKVVTFYLACFAGSAKAPLLTCIP